MGRFTFPQWVDRARPLATVLLLGAPVYAIGLLYYGGSPRTTDVGYQPEQPVPFSHALHAGELGMDCRYCHTTVEVAAHAAIPSTEICMNCHALIAVDSERLLPVLRSRSTGDPIRWVRVHDLPDYVYFDHSAHVTRGVGCYSCHGRVDRMEEVIQRETLS
ncbi:MAG: cytochrome c3 family protein, partial [Planctomycetota bacterium]